jgi:hypothetical protein
MPPLAILGIGLAAAGTATAVAGQVSAGNAAARAGEFNANTVTEAATIKEEEQRLADHRTLASARADVGASGVEMTGSPLDVMAESARRAEMNALIIRRGGVLDAYAARVAGKNAQRASRIGAVGTLLTGAAGIAGQVAPLVNTKPPATP